MIKPPPSSLMAEESLVAAMMLDPGLIAECVNTRLSPEAFYHPHVRVMFSKLVDMYICDEEIGTSQLAMALGPDIGLVGGYQKIAEVSDRVPTTVSARKHMRMVRDAHDARKMLTASRLMVEQLEGFSGTDSTELDGIVSDVETRVIGVRSHKAAIRPAKSITDFAPPPDHDEATLIGDRFICRGHACLVVGGSGMGKSTLAYQASIAWALGLQFLGLAPKKALVSLHIQAEDEDGDIGEVWASVKSGMGLDAEQVKKVGQNVIIKTEKVARGARFFQELQVLCARHNPDLVWLNPLHAYLEGDIKDAEATGKFCREGLANVNRNDRWAYMVVHHTPKPNMTGEKKQAREWNEVMYEAAGSADLVNWARAVMVLKARPAMGDFDLHLAKRGKRAGVVKQITDANGNPAWETSTRIPIKHSKGKLEVEGRSRPLPLLFWEIREEEEEEPEQDEKPIKRGVRTLTEQYPDAEMLDQFPGLEDEVGATHKDIQRTAGTMLGMSTKDFNFRCKDLEDDKLVERLPNGYLRRTFAGEGLVIAKQKATP